MKSISDFKTAVTFVFFAVLFSQLAEQTSAAYCSASGGCYEYIKSVQVGDIDNTGTSCGNYVDYTHLSTAMDIGQDYSITVINSDIYYEDDWCGIWVDWNQDEDFDDPNEEMAVSGNWHTFTATITPPDNAVSGNTRMRVRIRWMGAGTLEPCGTTPYGEVEDYTIVVLPSGPQTQIYGKKWHDLNDNGEMDGGEPGLSGWTIFLDEDRDGEIDPNDVVTTTDIQGNYELTGMEPNEYYYVSEVDQDGWINTYPGAGGIHYRIWVEENNDVEVNFGNYQLHNGDVNGFKFNDVNNNGVWDDGEAPLSDWEIYIDENENGQWDSGEPKTATSGAGYYEFTNLEPGYYNIMEVPQAGWFQTFPGITSGRLWGADSSADNVTYFVELDPETMAVKRRLVAPFYSWISGHCVFAAGPSTLFYCPLRITGFETADNLFFEIDPDTGLVVDQGVLDIPSNEIVWTCAWHRGILYVTSTDDIQADPPAVYLNRFDAFTKELISRVLLPEGFGDDMTTDPYRDLLLSNIAVPWSVYEINPDTAALVKTIKQQLPPKVHVAYTRGVLYRSFWAADEMQINHREDGSQISLIDYDENLRLDGMGGGVGVPGGHRVWVGKSDVTANFGNRLDSEGSFSGTKYEDLNGNGERDANEPGMADWMIYVDLDGDTYLDASEPATITDANGNWVIEGLEYGRYFVREVQQKGYVRTEPGLRWTDIVDINGPRDIVFDDMRNLLYVSTEAGEIERFDLNTNQFLSPVTVGGSPHGMDITADYGALYVADTQLSDGNAVVHKVDTDTLNVTDLTYSVGQFEDSSYDIAIGSEGIALITASYSGSGWVPLYVLDTSTDTITVRPDVLGQSTINDDVRLVRSYDRSTIWLINNSSNGWIGVYDAPSDTFTGENEFHNYLQQSPIALNHDGSMAAVQLDRHCRIVDSDFNMVIGLDDSKMGAEFDPSSDVFYQFQQRWHVLFALDTVVWELLDYVSPGGITETYERFTRGETAMTADGRVLGITDPNYVALHRKEHYALALPGRRISGLDFGNKTVLCGDVDGDRDVDFLDLRCLSEEWLCSELSMDVAPPVRDYVVSMPDFARLANAWQSLEGDSNWDVLCDVAPAGGDGSVDNKDLKMLTEEWLLEGMICLSDIAGADGPDGHVDLQDFACLAGNWLVAENIIEYEEDFETGDFSNLPWEHGGAAPWTIDSLSYFEGNYSAKSADLPWYDQSILSVTATCGEGEIYFMLRSGSGGTFRFFVDGSLVFDWDPWDEDVDWALVMIPVSAGIHTLEWSYEHDSHGEDHAWIDAIRFPPASE